MAVVEDRPVRIGPRDTVEKHDEVRAPSRVRPLAAWRLRRIRCIQRVAAHCTCFKNRRRHEQLKEVSSYCGFIKYVIPHIFGLGYFSPQCPLSTHCGHEALPGIILAR